MMFTDWFNCIVYIILVALCSASISYTITYAGLFAKFRHWLGQKNQWLNDLIHCPYCFGHYVILCILFTTSSSYYVPITDCVIYNFLFTWFAIVCVMSLFHAIMLIAYNPVLRNEIEEMKQFKEPLEDEFSDQ